MSTNTEPLVYTFMVACGQDHAFDVWTNKIDRWWPKNHSLSGDANPTIAIEGHRDGRIVERAEDGAEFEWGRITAWEPPNRLAYTWYAGSTPDKPTLVELTFTEDEGKTTVQLTSSGWEHFDDEGRLRNSNDQGWGQAVLAYRSHIDR